MIAALWASLRHVRSLVMTETPVAGPGLLRSWPAWPMSDRMSEHARRARHQGDVVVDRDREQRRRWEQPACDRCCHEAAQHTLAGTHPERIGALSCHGDDFRFRSQRSLQCGPWPKHRSQPAAVQAYAALLLSYVQYLHGGSCSGAAEPSAERWYQSNSTCHFRQESRLAAALGRPAFGLADADRAAPWGRPDPNSRW